MSILHDINMHIYPLLVMNGYNRIHPHWIEMKWISYTINLVLGETISCINSTIHIHLLFICLVFLWVVLNLQNAKELFPSFIFYCSTTMFKRWNTKTNRTNFFINAKWKPNCIKLLIIILDLPRQIFSFFLCTKCLS
jgi:hypothetical protein